MKYLIVLLCLLMIGCAGSAKKDEFDIDAEAPSTTADTPDDVRKGEAGADLETLSDNPPASGSLEPELVNPKPTITSNPPSKPKKKHASSASGKHTVSTKDCKVRSKASPSAKVTKKLKKGQTVSATAAGKAWYKLSTGGFVSKSCFK